MIQVHGLSKEYSGRVLFDEVNFSVSPGERIGLVGRNGMGKSTLFKIITGELSADEGSVDKPKGYVIASLSQFFEFTETDIVKECELALREDEKFDTYKVERILLGLGFQESDFTKAPESFSGGFQMRINLAKCLLEKPNLLLLDEPTNYLDIVSQSWLLNDLKRFDGEVMLITHDRDFMDGVVTHVVGIHRQNVKKIKGKFFNYKKQVEEEERVFESGRINQEKKRKQIEAFVTKFKAKAGQGSLASSRVKMLEKMEVYDKLENIRSLDFSFNEKTFLAKTHIKVENLSFGYDLKNPLFSDLNFHINQGDRIAIVGENGTGKSTLLKLLVGELEGYNGEINFHGQSSFGYFGQTNIESLHQEHTVEEEVGLSDPLAAYSKTRSVCGAMMFGGDDAKKKIKILSGGEKSRVMLGKILMKPCNVLVLDEPTHHLDQESVEVLLEKIQKFKGAVIIVSHNEFLLKRMAKKIVYFKDGNAHFFNDSYKAFLKTVGWSQDLKNKKSGKKSKETHSHTEIDSGKLKKEIKKLITEVENIETEIEKLELKKNELEQQIVNESSKAKNNVTQLSIEFAQLNEKLELKNSVYEKMFLDLEQKKLELG